MANKKFGETLRALRNSKGYTQQQVAKILELKNKSTLGSWEVGKSEPDGYTLLKLCSLYDVKDIYEAFRDVSPSGADEIAKELASSEDSKLSDVVRIFELLNEDMKEYALKQINFILELQGKHSV